MINLKSEKMLMKIYEPYEPETILFESSTPGSYNLEILGGIYLVYCIGAGGGGASSRIIGSRPTKTASAGGGSGSGFIGELYINKGSYSITVGAGGNGATGGGGWRYGGAGGNSLINNIVTSYGGGGGAGDGGGHEGRSGSAGSIPTIDASIISETLNSIGNNGSANGSHSGNTSGGASLYEGYGAGGAAGISSSDPYGYSGTTGYVKIVYKRLGG